MMQSSAHDNAQTVDARALVINKRNTDCSDHTNIHNQQHMKRHTSEPNSDREHVAHNKNISLPPIGHNSPRLGHENEFATKEGEFITDLSSKGTDSPRVLSRQNSKFDIDLSFGSMNLNSSPPTLRNHKLGSLSQSSTPTCSPRMKRRALERANSNGSFEIYRKPSNLSTQHVAAKIDSGLLRRAHEQSPASSPRILRRSQDVQSLIASELNDRRRSSSFSGCTMNGHQKRHILQHSLSHDITKGVDEAGRTNDSMSKLAVENRSISPPVAAETYLVSTTNLVAPDEKEANLQEVVGIEVDRTFIKCYDWLKGVEKAHQESMSLDDVTLPPVQWKD